MYRRHRVSFELKTAGTESASYDPLTGRKRTLFQVVTGVGSPPFKLLLMLEIRERRHVQLECAPELWLYLPPTSSAEEKWTLRDPNKIHGGSRSFMLRTATLPNDTINIPNAFGLPLSLLIVIHGSGEISLHFKCVCTHTFYKRLFLRMHTIFS